MFFSLKRVFLFFIVVIIEFFNSLNAKTPIAYNEIILDPNYDEKGINVLDVSIFKRLRNTVVVINTDFDLQGKTLNLEENICIKFDGGSISNGIISLQKSNELFSTYEKQCFKNIVFTGTYSKVFPLSLVGIIADGEDKSDILSNLSQMIYTNANSIYCVFTKLSISGDIKCDKNEINIPANIDIYGLGGASINFTSAMGNYCISVSHNTGLHNITLKSSNIDFCGAILTGDCRIYDRKKNLYGGATFLNLIDVKISGRYSENGTCLKCTGIRFVASNKETQDFRYFTNIQSDVLRIVNTKIGLEVIYQNYESEKYTWGNEININNLYISANTCGIKFITEEYAKKNVIQESGHSCFGIYKFQAVLPTAVAFDVESVSQIIFLDFVSWDNSIWGIVRKNASVGIMYDMRPFITLNSQKTKDKDSNIYLSLKENNKERYKIYKGLIERKLIQYKL